MPRVRDCIFAAMVIAGGLACAGQEQDSPPSLGDVARQARQQKKETQTGKAGQADGQVKSAPPKILEAKPASTPGTPEKAGQTSKGPKRVVTNDEIPEHVGPTSTRPQLPVATPEYQQPYYGDGKIPAEYWRNRIQAQKDGIASLKNSIDSTLDSIRYTGGNCISNCVDWNLRQEQKQRQVESMKMQLDQAQQQLEEMQEMARKQGYGSSVYDP